VLIEENKQPIRSREMLNFERNNMKKLINRKPIGLPKKRGGGWSGLRRNQVSTVEIQIKHLVLEHPILKFSGLNSVQNVSIKYNNFL